MPKVKKICRVCGKEYEACHTPRSASSSVFRWQDVACSPECGEEYLRRIIKSRSAAEEQPFVESVATAEVVADIADTQAVPASPKKRTHRKRVPTASAAESES